MSIKYICYLFNKYSTILISMMIYKFNKRDKNVWVFGEWMGKKCCDNSLFLANFVCEHYPSIKAYWISEKTTDLSRLDKRVVRLEMDTPAADEILKMAGVVFTIQKFDDLTKAYKRYYQGALKIWLWHGVPWKKIDIRGKDGVKSKILKQYVQLLGPDLYLASSNKFAKIWEFGYYAKPENLLKAGYPRNSGFYEREFLKESKMELIAALNSHGYHWLSNETKIITYMPTFRDKKDDIFSFVSIRGNLSLKKILEFNNAIIIEKSHFITNLRGTVYSSDIGSRVICIPDYFTPGLLAATDILITDYSSCFFDFLILNRPIIHYLYDYNYYKNDDRGLYYTKEEVACGDCPTNIDELINSIDSNLSNPTKGYDLRKMRISQYINYESPESCGIIVQNVFKRLSNR